MPHGIMNWVTSTRMLLVRGLPLNLQGESVRNYFFQKYSRNPPPLEIEWWPPKNHGMSIKTTYRNMEYMMLSSFWLLYTIMLSKTEYHKIADIF